MDFKKNNIKTLIDEWFLFRDEDLSHLTSEDKNHLLKFDEYADNIIRNVSENNKKYVNKQLELLSDNFVEYASYWEEKYYMNGFKDAICLILFGLGGDK